MKLYRRPSHLPVQKPRRVHNRNKNRSQWGLGDGVDLSGILPTQIGSPRQLAPEMRLCLAVLEDAVIRLSKSTTKNIPGYADAEWRWVNSNDETWPFSFVNLCLIVGLEPACVRKALKQHLPFIIRTCVDAGQRGPQRRIAVA